MGTWNYISDSIQGTERRENKDRVWVKENGTSILAVLFDGISSAQDANKGIDVAIEFLEKVYSEIQSTNNFQLSDLMYRVNQKVASANLSSPFTTCSAALLLNTANTTQQMSLYSRVFEKLPSVPELDSRTPKLSYILRFLEDEGDSGVLAGVMGRDSTNISKRIKQKSPHIIEV